MRFIDLFAGIGGFRLGLERANIKPETKGQGQEARDSQGCSPNFRGEYVETATFSCVWSCDIDKYCEQIYKKNFGEGFDCYDITAYDVSRIPEHELLCAGFPCQSFSIAGKRRGFEDARGTLFFEICRVLRAKRTPYILLENVKGLLSHDEGATFLAIIRYLDELGYGYQWEVLNSKNFGVPQNRERVFIIGHLRGQPRPKVFPIGEDGEQFDNLAGETKARGQGLEYKDVVPALRGGDKWQSVVGSLTGGGHSGGLHSNMTIIGCQQAQGGNIGLELGSKNEPMPQIAQALQTDGFLRQGVSWGTDNPQSRRNIRRLTPTECERLQGFPDGWTEGVSDTQRYKMLGNAVTVNVVEAIGERL